MNIKSPAYTVLLALLLMVRLSGQVTTPVTALQNGDFSSGLAHWSGDGSSATGASGIKVNLLDTWTKITQDFEAKSGNYTVTVTFTLGPDTTFSSEGKDYRRIPDKLGFTGLKEFRVKHGDWCMLITNIAARRFEHCAITPGGSSASQTISGTVPISGDGEQNTFCLAFPPGHGTITIQSVSMTKAQ